LRLDWRRSGREKWREQPAIRWDAILRHVLGIMVAQILGLAFIESLVLFTLVIIFVKVA
jgi:hypothetical protein